MMLITGWFDGEHGLEMFDHEVQTLREAAEKIFEEYGEECLGADLEAEDATTGRDCSQQLARLLLVTEDFCPVKSHEDKAEVGEAIRSYDFEPMADRPSSYIEGIVISKRDFMYHIAVQNRVFAGKKEQVQVGETVQTPMRLVMMEYPDRIQKVEV